MREEIEEENSPLPQSLDRAETPAAPCTSCRDSKLHSECRTCGFVEECCMEIIEMEIETVIYFLRHWPKKSMQPGHIGENIRFIGVSNHKQQHGECRNFLEHLEETESREFENKNPW